MTTHPRTIHHVAREQRHLAWDNSLSPVLTITSGEIVQIDAVEASGGQIGPNSQVADIATLDFAACDPVQGPIYVAGAEPGDTLQIEILDLQTADWGWTAVIPGFGLLADEFPSLIQCSKYGHWQTAMPNLYQVFVFHWNRFAAKSGWRRVNPAPFQRFLPV